MYKVDNKRKTLLGIVKLLKNKLLMTKVYYKKTIIFEYHCYCKKTKIQKRLHDE